MAGFTYSTLTTAILNYTEVVLLYYQVRLPINLLIIQNLEYKEKFQLMQIEKKC